MVIIHAIDSTGIYGAEQVLLNLMVAQKKAGHSITLFSLRLPEEIDRPIDKQTKELGINVISFACPPGPRLEITRNLCDLIHTLKADICHNHGYRTNILLALTYNRPKHCSFLTTNHGWTDNRIFSRIWWYKCVDILCQNRLDASIFVNPYVSRNGLLHLLNWKKAHFIANGVQEDTDTSCLNQAAVQNIRSLKTHNNLLLSSIGRLSQEKNQLLFLQALVKLKKDGLNISAVLIGDGPEQKALKLYCQQQQIEDQVLFLGYLSNAAQYISLMDALVISSTTEGLPMVLLEAMSKKVPVISSKVGAIPGIINDQQSGYLFQSNNLDELCHAITQLKANTSIQTLTETAYTLFKTQYSSTKMADQYQVLYNKLHSEKSGNFI